MLSPVTRMRVASQIAGALDPHANSDTKRKHLRRALFHALRPSSGSRRAFIYAVQSATKCAMTTSAAIDRLAVSALGWAIQSAINAGPDATLDLLTEAVSHPDTYSHSSKRSPSGYALGHHITWPSGVMHDTTLRTLIPTEEVTPMIKPAFTQDIPSLCNLGIALLDDKFGDRSERSTLANITAMADEIGKAASLGSDETEALKSLMALMVGSSSANDRILLGHAMPEYKHFKPTEPGEVVEEVIEVDESLASAIGTLLNKATGGKLSDIKATVKELRELRHEVNVLKAKAAFVPTIHIASTAGEDTIDGSKLTYEVVMRNVGDLFPHPKTGKKVKHLDFEIPTLVWKDDKGNEVQHPDCEATDPNYQFSPKNVMRLATAFLLRKNVWTHGHSGAGKTTIHGQFFSRIGMPVYRINLDSSLERSDLIGTEVLSEKGGATVSHFREGILPQAITKPCVILMDEIDYGRPDILASVQRALEGKGLLLTEDGGRLVKPHELQRWAATANSRGQGDEFGVYPGVRPLNAAMLDRFSVMIEIEYMAEEDEKELIERTFPGIAETFTKQLVSFAKMIRSAFVNGEISTTLSPRGTLAIAEQFTFHQGRLGETKAREEAIEVVVIDRSTMDNRQRVLELASRAFS
jgi:cobaltochelatase CobS